MKSSYLEIVTYLESLQMMPKAMPGLQKIRRALAATDWFQQINPKKIILVAGTNGKGSTCAMLEALLVEAGKKVGFYSSPHLVTTTERLHLNTVPVSEEIFVKIYEECQGLVKQFELSHFEALTLMAGHWYFSKSWNLNLDYVILEVGLGGTFDATNAFHHAYSVITALDFDHTSILGHTLNQIAQNKFGIVQSENKVIYQALPLELQSLKNNIVKTTNSTAFEVEAARFEIRKVHAEPHYILQTKWGEVNLSLKGRRGAENAMTALRVFEVLGFDPTFCLQALSRVKWAGRMQKVLWSGLPCPLYLSGDHNPQGIQSLIEILLHFSWQKLHVIIGIGADKDAEEMLTQLIKLPRVELYLTVTPFKGRSLSAYPEKYLHLARQKGENILELIDEVAKAVEKDDLVIVTGSLYLVGEVLKHLKFNLENQPE